MTASMLSGSYLDRFENLFLVGRNGMHKYNNQDHSMLTAMTAVENIVNGVTAKDNIWAIKHRDGVSREEGCTVTRPSGISLRVARTNTTRGRKPQDPYAHECTDHRRTPARRGHS